MKMPAFLLIVAFCCVNLAAQERTFSPEIKRVAVFKNGYAFTYREGEASPNSGWVYTTSSPVGVLGTIWGYSTTANVRVDQLLASELLSTTKTERVEDIAEMLLANEGKRLRFSDTYNVVFEGVYEIVSRHRGFERDIRPQDGYRAEFDLSMITLSLKTESGVMLIPANSVRKIEILDAQPNLTKPKKEKLVRLGLKVNGASDGKPVNVGIAALERGLRWIPAYRVEVKGDPIKEAKLELEANVVNDLADLKNTEINFVVGVPHFMFQDMASPLSINTAFAGVSSGFRRDDSNRRLSNAISSQVVDLSMDGVGVDDVSPTIAGEERSVSFSAEQLFLYQTNILQLKKGERATTRLFSLTVPCSEVFEWTINDVSDAHQRYLNPGYSGQANQLNSLQDLTTKIWYALRLKNTTGMPWTTAPAISFREWKPLGQDLLKFTAIGGEEVLRVTPATELTGFHSLEEKERVRERLRWSGSDYDFDLVTVEGTIKVRNVQKQAVELVLTRNLVGQVTSASDEAKVTKSGLNLQSVNSNSIVKWNVQIPPGEKELRYSYKVYVRK
jgi:hypothetical protein